MIEIHKPELEALTRERMDGGVFLSVEGAQMQALKTSPLPPEDARLSNRMVVATGADLVAAMQASPDSEIDLEPVSPPDGA